MAFHAIFGITDLAFNNMFASDNKSSNIIEGVGTEVIYTCIIAFIVLALMIFMVVMLERMRARRRQELIVEQNRAELRRRGEELALEIVHRRPDVPRAFNESQCPVCLNVPVLAVETDCRHLLCGTCSVDLYQRSNRARDGFRCPLCRHRIGVLFIVFSPEDRINDELGQDRVDVLTFVRNYNRVVAVDLDFIERLQGIPVLLRHFFWHLVEGDDFGDVYLRVRLIGFIIFAFAYIASPYDIVPEMIYGIYGFAEDIFLLLLILYYISELYRNRIGI